MAYKKYASKGRTRRTAGRTRYSTAVGVRGGKSRKRGAVRKRATTRQPREREIRLVIEQAYQPSSPQQMSLQGLKPGAPASRARF